MAVKKSRTYTGKDTKLAIRRAQQTQKFRSKLPKAGKWAYDQLVYKRPHYSAVSDRLDRAQARLSVARKKLKKSKKK